MLRYPIILNKDDNDTFLVTSPDFPELGTFGDDEAEAIVRAADALVTVIAERIASREDVPVPTKSGAVFAPLGTSDTLKIALYKAMRDDGVGKAQLAKRMACHLPQIDRLLDLHHESRLDQLEAALRAMGRDISVDVTKAA